MTFRAASNSFYAPKNFCFPNCTCISKYSIKLIDHLEGKKEGLVTSGDAGLEIYLRP